MKFFTISASFFSLLGWLLPAISSRGALPSIDYQPQSQDVMLYQQGAFSVIASGAAPLTYQWRKNTISIPGATNDQIVLKHAKFSDVGAYSVVVSNAEGTATSSDAGLSVRLPKAGDLDYSFVSTGNPPDGQVRAVAVQPDGKVLVGGEFSSLRGSARGRIARLNSDGTLDDSFMNELLGANNTVFSIALQPDGKILIGGAFTAVNRIDRNGVARLNPDGTLDTGFANSDATSLTLSIVVRSDGKILLGGSFGVLRLNSDGSMDSGFVNGANDWVFSIAVQTDGKILIGGIFIVVHGVLRFGVARLNDDGALDSTFSPALSIANWRVYSVATQNDGKVLIAGAFTEINNVTRNGIARLNSDGTLDTSFANPVSGANFVMFSVVVQPDGKVLIGGDFFPINGVGRNHIARLNGDGTFDAGFGNSASGANGTVWSMALQSDGRIVIGGSFFSVNAAPTARIARLWGSADIPPIIVNIAHADRTVTLTWEAVPGRTYGVQYATGLLANDWTDILGQVSASTGIATKTHSSLDQVSQRFYRVVLLP